MDRRIEGIRRMIEFAVGTHGRAGANAVCPYGDGRTPSTSNPSTTDNPSHPTIQFPLRISTIVCNDGIIQMNANIIPGGFQMI